jgi:peptidyl-prolyl isomerase E (cyclophilin E)
MNNRAMSSSEEGGSQHDMGGALAHPPPAADGAVSTVYVGNLPASVDEYLLMVAFAPFGPITHVQVIKDKGSNLSRGYGFVSYAHPLYATVAMQQMNQQVLFGPFAGQRIKVAPSKRH